MRGDQLARQWRILPAIESKKHGTTVAELASQEDCSSCTIWRDLATIQKAQLPLLFQFNPMRDSQHQRKPQLATRDLQ
jgi:predicted DNA-binding transcriptional regulator YafY